MGLPVTLFIAALNSLPIPHRPSPYFGKTTWVKKRLLLCCGTISWDANSDLFLPRVAQVLDPKCNAVRSATMCFENRDLFQWDSCIREELEHNANFVCVYAQFHLGETQGEGRLHQLDRAVLRTHRTHTGTCFKHLPVHRALGSIYIFLNHFMCIKLWYCFSWVPIFLICVTDDVFECCAPNPIFPTSSVWLPSTVFFGMHMVHCSRAGCTEEKGWHYSLSFRFLQWYVNKSNHKFSMAYCLYFFFLSLLEQATVKLFSRHTFKDSSTSYGLSGPAAVLANTSKGCGCRELSPARVHCHDRSYL